MVKKTVIKLTGALFDFPSNEEGLEEILRIAEVLKETGRKLDKILVVTGGGRRLRELLNALRKKGVKNEGVLDQIGIMYTRLNAYILISILNDNCAGYVPETLDEVLVMSLNNKIVVTGGLLPGFSTNAVAALIAELINADLLVMMTRAGAVYDKDPEKFPDAKPVQEISIKELRGKLLEFRGKAGHYPLLDHLSLDIIERARILTAMIPPRADALRKILRGEKVGTIIRP